MYLEYNYDWMWTESQTLPTFTVMASDEPKGTLGFFKLRENVVGRRTAKKSKNSKKKHTR